MNVLAGGIFEQLPGDALDNLRRNNTVAGDPAYAPPELLYGYLDPDWNRRRFGCDAYLMGSMVVFFCTLICITPLLRAALHHAHTWAKWAGTYDAVLPYVRDAFGRAVEAFKGQARPEARDTVVRIVRELCEPDPKLRGHPLNRAGRGNQYSLERYVAEFDLLARRAELGILASNRP